MRGILFITVFICSVISLYSNDKCKEAYCYDEWGEPIQSKRLDPHTIRWPLHITGEVVKDGIDGGQGRILVRYESHYVTKTLSLQPYRSIVGEAWFCKDGLTLPQPYECTSGEITEPTFDRNVCSIVGVSKSVRRINVSEGCYKEIIDWAVIDWCAYSGSDYGGKDNDDLFLIKDLAKGTEYYGYSGYYGNLNRDGAYHYQQVIKVGDNTPPSIIHKEEVAFSAKVNCKACIKVGNKAIDNGECPSSIFQWRATIKDNYGYSKVIYPSKVGSDSAYVYLENLPTGQYNLTWTVKDGCGNGTAHTQKVVVEDNVAPTVVCIASLSIGVGSPSDPAQIWASDYVKTVLDNCTNDSDIVLSFSQDSVQKSIDLNCAEHFGETYMPIYAFDKNGNIGACEVKAKLNSKDPDCSRDVDVQGMLSDPQGNPLSNATLSVIQQDGTTKTTITTDEEGRFSYIDGISLGESLTLHYDEMPISAKVSFVDILALNKHVNGLSPFTEVYQDIAADIDGNSVIDITDLEILVKHIMTRGSNTEGATLGMRLVEKNTMTMESDILLEDETQLELIAIPLGDVYE